MRRPVVTLFFLQLPQFPFLPRLLNGRCHNVDDGNLFYPAQYAKSKHAFYDWLKYTVCAFRVHYCCSESVFNTIILIVLQGKGEMLTYWLKDSDDVNKSDDKTDVIELMTRMMNDPRTKHVPKKQTWLQCHSKNLTEKTKDLERKNSYKLTELASGLERKLSCKLKIDETWEFCS